MPLIDEPLLTHVLNRSEMVLPSASLYLYGAGVEDRSVISSSWRKTMETAGCEFVEVDENFGPDKLELEYASGPKVVSTRRASELETIFDPSRTAYIDITGMTYSAWAPLLRAALKSGCRARVVYVEPIGYSRSSTPARGMQFDLTESFSRLGPLPGFTKVRNFALEDWVLVVLAGFEGSRFSHVVNELEPSREGVVPIFGLPGFRPEFVAHALLANQLALEESVAGTRIRYAKANCPFDTFHTLYKIHNDYSGVNLRVAPVGTKPHGVGAVLYALSRPSSVQLVYDFPVRKAKRTLGSARVCVYDVSEFCESDLFNEAGEFGR